jgi:N-acetylmuramoyl-L-alanine amidase
LFLPLAARGDKKSQAREQFERAVAMRTQLEGYLPKDRSLANYKQTVAAYHKVYLISAQAEEVTPALIAQAELYEEMGKQFDPKYFQSAIDTYKFLLQQYPGTRYRGEALLSIGKIQKNDLNTPDIAEATLKDFLKKYPRSDKASDARALLNELAEAKEKKQIQTEPAVAEQPEKGATENDLKEKNAAKHNSGDVPLVTDIHTWNSQDHTRIVVTLDDAVKYEAARLRAPDRIYFDIYKARLGPTLLGKSINLDSGLLKSVRMAQNKQGVVRLVLDVNGAKDYSSTLLTKPSRLVIDVQTDARSASNHDPAPDSAIVAAANVSSSQPKPPVATPVDTKSAETVKVNASKLDPVASKPIVKTNPAKAKAEADAATQAALRAPNVPRPTKDGQLPLTRALGLKISRIVIDAGHGGHDTGTIGPRGLMEKDLCLDVALRLGKEIEEKIPGTEVVYTRKDDTFIPLEDRTALANQAKADLFISIHANSSHDHEARGIETYYLNFATSEESMEVAARENALSQESLHDLQNLIQKIARNEKIEESKELAGDIQDSLAHRMQIVSQSERNRGVKKAPFVVLIGANMPSVLTEISFISNPSDEKLLKKADQRQRVADGLYRGVSQYLENLNSLSLDRSKLVSQSHPSAPTTSATMLAPTGNPK